ncbi:MAG: YggS family pyridoxal phosphate enzyme [bacterium]|nr:MAG: YggS family pyridoxal phosphate enzyme [bacterium]
MSVQDNLIRIHKKINDLRKPAGQDITLIAVSKQKPVEAIQEAIEAGQLIFGENRLQEAVEKLPAINNTGVEWHFIGHLQKNKVKKAVDLFHVIHSVDKISTAKEISKHCVRLDKTMSVFVQVNTTNEPQKGGVDPNHLKDLLERLIPIPNLHILGLMTISLFTKNQDQIRRPFSLLRSLKDRMNQEIPSLNLKYLSMGMSGDYELAIEEGATHLRIGTAIFGDRVKT